MSIRPRVLLLEDHDALRRFVGLALEPLELDLRKCASAAEARAEIAARGPVSLVLTDLMMPGESGLDFLQYLRSCGEPWASTVTVIVLSASVSSAQRSALAALMVSQILIKPVGVDSLLTCVRQALRLAPDGTPATPSTDPTRPSTHQAAIADHFGGDQELFFSYRRSCILQFPADIDEGEAALARADWPAMRRLGHSLKTVLRLLGDGAGAQHASAIEQAAAASDTATLAQTWPLLRQVLRHAIQA